MMRDQLAMFVPLRGQVRQYHNVFIKIKIKASDTAKGSTKAKYITLLLHSGCSSTLVGQRGKLFQIPTGRLYKSQILLSLQL
jgi:hypothetical protein